MSDVLYILGRGSKHDNMELRLSLRTLEANGKNIDRLFIVGNCPEWVQNAIHIPAEDTYQSSQNHAYKVIVGCYRGISDNFLLMNDDFFMLEPFDVEKYPYYVRGELEEYKEPSFYQKTLNKTREYLIVKGIEHPMAFNVHCPIIYNKKNFMTFEELFHDVKFEDVGYSWRTLYGNTFVKDYKVVSDCKDYDDVFKESETGCLSTSDNCDKILEEVEKRFNKKSRWEK